MILGNKAASAAGTVGMNVASAIRSLSPPWSVCLPPPARSPPAGDVPRGWHPLVTKPSSRRLGTHTHHESGAR